MKFDKGSSRYFTLVAVVLKDFESAKAVRVAVDELRRDLGWNPQREFKHNKTNHHVKSAFFERIAAFDFCFHSFTLNKPDLQGGALGSHDRLYRMVTGWTIENIFGVTRVPPTTDHVSIVFDSCGGSTLYDHIRRHARAEIERRVGPQVRSVLVTAEDSQRENCLQLADMLGGAVYTKWNGKPSIDAYEKMIAHKCKTERFWPRSKTTKPAAYP